LPRRRGKALAAAADGVDEMRRRGWSKLVDANDISLVAAHAGAGPTAGAGEHIALLRSTSSGERPS